MLGKVYLIPSLIVISMFRRRRRRRSAKRFASTVTHVPSSISNGLSTNTSLIFYAAIPANYAVTGTALSSDTFENADRQQNCPIGSTIDNIVFNIAFRGLTDNGVMEYAFFKIERSNVVPTGDNVMLPNDTVILSQGLQSAIRQYQPGRVLHYGQVAVATEQPRCISKSVPYGKFKLSKLRTGDYYGVQIFNRSAATVFVDVQARYKAKI